MTTRVLYILSNEPTGGVGTVVLNFQKHFDEDIKVDYLIYTETRDSYFQKEIKALGSNVYYLPEFQPKNIFELYKKTELFFKNHVNEYKIAHLHFAGIAFLVFPLAEKYGVKHRIVHSHNVKLSDNKFKDIRNKLLCFNIKRTANHFFACSMDAANYLFGKAFCAKNHIELMRNGIELSKYAFSLEKRNNIRKFLKIDDLTKVLINVGRLEEQKNHKFMIEMMKYLKDEDIKLILIGEGPLKKELEILIKNNDLVDKVFLLGAINNVEDFLSASDLFIFPSLYEGLGIAAIEAQANGLYCLIADNITDEVVATNNVKKLPLDLDSWIKESVLYSRDNIKEYYQSLINNGYDINDEAHRISEIYRGMK